MNKKKLLILGANIETIPLVEVAKNLGVTTYVTDYNFDAPAKIVADVACHIDCMDIAALEQFCLKEKIDGIMVGVADSLVKTYAQLCERLNLPCYATKEQAEILSNKKLFDEQCKLFDIPTIDNYPVDLDSFEETERKVTYPVFVKPIDGNSGKGISICENANELKTAIKKAIEASFSGMYLVERYMTCTNILFYFTFINGSYYLSAIGEKSTIKQKNDGSVVTQAVVYTSKYHGLYNKKLKNKLEEMLKSMGIINGVLQISAFVENDEIYLYDPGFRLQGEATDTHIAKSTGFDQKEMLVKFALDNNSNKSNQLPVLDNDYIYISKWLLLKEGRINKIKGLDELSGNNKIYVVHQRLFENQMVTSDMVGTERQVLARIYFKASQTGALELLKKIDTTSIAVDEHGNDLIIKAENQEKLFS